jgi:hypothetical protein
MKKKENDYDSFSKETSEQETEFPFTTFQALARSVANSKDFISSPSLASLRYPILRVTVSFGYFGYQAPR